SLSGSFPDRSGALHEKEWHGRPARESRAGCACHVQTGGPKPIPIAQREFTCPMHPEVRQSGPGACPKCGMSLEPSSAVAPTRIEYTCPMHPEIVRDKPGNCPICGMALEPRTI